MKALGYIRISKDEAHSVSLEYQRANIEKYCQDHDLTLVGVEEDNGISGETIKKRPGVKQVLQAVDSNSVDCVVVFKSDRISRDGIESLNIEKLFLARGVQYLSVSEGSLANGSIDDEFMGYIRAGLNQRERKLIAYRTKQAWQRKREKGERLGGRVHYGLNVTNRELVIDPDEQKAVALVKNLKAQGFTTRAIVRVLDQENIRTRKGTAFGQTQVVRILKVA